MSEDYTVYESTIYNGGNYSTHTDLDGINYHQGSISSDYLPIDELKELTQEQIRYTIRNYVRKERFNELEERYSKDMLVLLDKISELERKLNQVYYPMRTVE